jgi:hypothetical protein
MGEFKSQLLDRDNSLAHLRGQISDMTPSAEIGVSIRHRFLEKERISIAKQNGQAVDAQRQDIIDKGNSAAHGGNGAVDASLFKHGFFYRRNTSKSFVTCTNLRIQISI